MNGFIDQLIINFSRGIEQLELTTHSHFLLREDGVLIHHHNVEKLSIEPSAISALMAGAWQASFAMTAQLNTNHALQTPFRMSFDNSLSGIYILPIVLEHRPYYLGTIYQQTINPGALKSKLRSLVNLLADGTLESKLPKTNTKPNVNQREYLFKDISDDEISAVFSKVES
ncbi:MAG: hypothetical protein HN353_02475 [Bdellovibrionales bacterium]|jgi:hypothetical protein|nr:hypothetical protein [Bdellovibrionales bacterium]MBT3525552.1 hypothetical protein [Bdellovibrionales bacterium]MBT7668089.1 hypothetical protein [Bdellovibrionales bacterium]MBT7767359.1 hypothetical protein [Bdellovibrionales bacterium]